MQRKIKTIAGITALIFIIASAPVMTAMAAEVVINDASAYPDTITFTDITLENIKNVGVIDLYISYDPSTVIVIAAKDSDFDAIIPNLVKNDTGLVRIGAFQTDNPGLNGSVIVANLTLKAVGDSGSTSSLNIIVNELTDATPQLNDIPYTITPRTFTVTSSGESTSTSTTGGGGGSGGFVISTPTPTATPTSEVAATPTTTETPDPLLAPASTPLTTPTQIPATTSPLSVVEPLIIGLIALAATATIIIFAKYQRRR